MHVGIPGISDIAYISPVTLDSASDDVALQFVEVPQAEEQEEPVSPSVHPEGELCVMVRGWLGLCFGRIQGKGEHT